MRHAARPSSAPDLEVEGAIHTVLFRTEDVR
jgi:hypothetical protein